MKRICTICNLTKPFTEFYWDKRINLPFSRCKICYAAKCQKYRMSHRGKQIYKKWSNSKRGKEVRKNALYKWRLHNSIKRKAHSAVSNALRDKKIFKNSCFVCGNEKVEAHHTSYKKENWLNVQWLCKKHHTEITFYGKFL